MRRAAALAAVALVGAATLAGGTQAAEAPPLSGVVVALSLGDPALQAGVIRGGEIVLARGFEVALARSLARRLGLPIERFVELRSGRGRTLLAGGRRGCHLALAELEPSRSVRASADVSVPYLTTDVAVVLRRGLARPARVADLRGQRLCAVRGSDGARAIWATVGPRRAAALVVGEDRLRTLVRTGACDAAVVPAIEVGRFVHGHAHELGPVAGRIAYGDGLVVAVARRTGLDVAPVDRALRRLRTDGTLGRLARSWLRLDPARLRTLR
jgi:ABC-type amino acid transport substrate-binding protein